jgi:hypothetical protein
MPPLVPGPAGFITVATTEQLRAAIDGMLSFSNLSLFVPPGTVLHLNGVPINMSKVNLQLVSGGEGATIDAGGLSTTFMAERGGRLRLATLVIANGQSLRGGVMQVGDGVEMSILQCLLVNCSAHQVGSTCLCPSMSS